MGIGSRARIKIIEPRGKRGGREVAGAGAGASPLSRIKHFRTRRTHPAMVRLASDEEVLGTGSWSQFAKLPKI